MTRQLTDWWRVRTPREQRLLLVMIALLAVVIVWAGIIRPVDDGLAEAHARHRAAVETLARAQAAAEAVSALERTPPPPLPGSLATVVSQSAIDAGFTSAAVSEQGPNRIILTIPAARPAAFFGWIGGLQSRGIIVERLAAKPNSDPTLAIDATLIKRTR